VLVPARARERGARLARAGHDAGPGHRPGVGRDPVMETMWDSSTRSTGLMTDLYHPDAAYISWRTGHNEPTTFDLYTRAAPFEGAYLLAAGLELALDFVRHFRYTDDDIAYLRQIRDYDDRFLRELLGLRFSGEILA